MKGEHWLSQHRRAWRASGFDLSVSPFENPSKFAKHGLVLVTARVQKPRVCTGVPVASACQLRLIMFSEQEVGPSTLQSKGNPAYKWP